MTRSVVSPDQNVTALLIKWGSGDKAAAGNVAALNSLSPTGDTGSGNSAGSGNITALNAGSPTGDKGSGSSAGTGRIRAGDCTSKGIQGVHAPLHWECKNHTHGP